jgi:hypothetical protein
MSFPRNNWEVEQLQNINVQVLNETPNTVIEPLNRGRGVSATYNPEGNACLEFLNPQNSVDSTVDWDRGEVGGFVLIVSGAVSGTTIICTTILNYEGLPSSNALSFVSSVQMPFDPLGMADATNLREEDRLVESGLQGMDGLTPTSPSSASAHAVTNHYPLLLGTGSHSQVHSTGVLRRARGSPRNSRDRMQEAPQLSTFERVLQMVLPLAAKFLGAVI